ncbi:MAG: DUF2785 domain-containing protein [Ktedonobacteraceae bacterium]
MDKTFWQSIVDNEYALPPQQSVAELAPELLANLGSTDPERREQSATMLEKWVNREYYTSGELSRMTAQLSDNLTVGLGEHGTDTVLLRSFSALTLAEIVYYDYEHPFLSESQLRQLLEDGLAYFLAERDLRGHESGLGWIHAVAHGSDLLAVLALHDVLQKADLECIMEAIATKVAPSVPHAYLYNEDQRLVRAVLWTLQRNLLTMEFLGTWLDQIAHYEGKPIGVESFLALLDGNKAAIVNTTHISILHNTKQFLRSLYFHLVNAEQPPVVLAELLPKIQVALELINAF